MPVARLPASGLVVNSSRTLYTGVTIPPGGYLEGTAVGLLVVGAEKQLIAVGALSRGVLFAGFCAQDLVEGGSVLLTSGRASIVTPRVENGDPLVPELSIFLSSTPGLVTQSPLDPMLSPGALTLRVGYALDTEKMVLMTDAFIQYGG